jgi:alkylation response protein AidB-like acyl-CoA dehydrogenase
MDLRPSAEQEQLVDAFASLYAKQSSIEAVRAAEPHGFDAELWARLGEMGATAMAAPEADGGWGATMLDLALIAEQQGRFLAPAPVIETQATARLLARLATPAAAEVLAAALEGSQLVSMALRPAAAGELRFVPAGLVANTVVARVDDRIVAVTPIDPTPVENLGAVPVADLQVAGAVELAAGPGAVEAYEVAIDEWLALTANALVGIGARGLEIGVDYVKERHAFGVPIGSFQSIAHHLADSATAIDGARLLAWEAAWAFGAEPGRARQLANMAFGFAYESARDATYRALHYHGGYGFMMEYDIQLYYRRARAWATVFGDPVTAYGRVADRRFGAVPR